jgi:glycosyltransferase involved in cell wall biosynthesis
LNKGWQRSRSEMRIAHLLASPFYGGPERQVLGLAQHLPSTSETLFFSFAERGRAGDFLGRAAAAGFEAVMLQHNWPHAVRAVREISAHLRRAGVDIVCTSGYKPDLLGWLAARRVGLPVVAIAHGWTGATRKVRWNETLDRWVMRQMDRVVCVSKAEANRVRAAGVRPEHTVVIENAVATDDVAPRNAQDRGTLEGFFPRRPRTIIVAAGRLSVEKGFDILVDAAALLAAAHPEAGFVLFGDGPLRPQLAQQIAQRKLDGQFVLGGFQTDLHRLLPQADLLVLSSHTEGMPVIVLEALAAGLPVVATAVGGVPEVIHEAEQGLLVPAGDAHRLAAAIDRLLGDDSLRQRLGEAGRQRIVEHYSCRLQAIKYQQLFDRLLAERWGQERPLREPDRRGARQGLTTK